ncbi:MAG: NAD-dependent epimerase/dehydratase family protein [Acidimicrobiales bacterium]
MRCLVLGGSAFIGRRLVEVLLEAGHDMCVLNRGSRSTIPDGVELLVADRRRPETVRAALAGRDWDAVFDVSGQVQVAPLESMAELADGLAGRCGVYVFLSSIAAYAIGNGTFPWTEDLPLSTSRPTGYGGHKAAVERLLAQRHAERGFPSVVLRPAAVYGPHDNIPDGEMAMFLRLRQHRPVLVPHEGLVAFNYGHVDDLVDAMVLAATVPAALGQTFNITADAVTALQYVQTIAGIVGVQPDVRFVPEPMLPSLGQPPPFNHRFQKVLHSVLSIERARRVLGFEPRYDFAGGHRQTYEWFLAEGLDRADAAWSDPVWNMSWDFDREAGIAEAIAAAGQPPR